MGEVRRRALPGTRLAREWRRPTYPRGRYAETLRFIRALKNRFGPTDEVGCFEMTGDGIAEVPDPSGLFLSQGATEPTLGPACR